MARHRMKKRYKIGFLYCGGCNPYYERVEVFEKLTSRFQEECSFFLYDPTRQQQADGIVLLNGCPSPCLVNQDYPGKFLLIDNSNYTEAGRLFSDLLTTLPSQKGDPQK